MSYEEAAAARLTALMAPVDSAVVIAAPDDRLPATLQRYVGRTGQVVSWLDEYVVLVAFGVALRIVAAAHLATIAPVPGRNGQ